MQTVLEKSTGKVVYCTDGEFQETETLIAVPELVTEDFVEAYFNWTDRTFYEGATAEQISQLKKSMVPLTVSRRQLRLALAFAQFDLSQIDQQINQLPEPNRTFALIAWNDAVVFERKDALLNQLALQLGLNEEALDDLFINAGKL